MLRPWRTTLKPRWASSWEIASPIPSEAPVTSAHVGELLLRYRGRDEERV